MINRHNGEPVKHPQKQAPEFAFRLIKAFLKTEGENIAGLHMNNRAAAFAVSMPDNVLVIRYATPGRWTPCCSFTVEELEEDKVVRVSVTGAGFGMDDGDQYLTVAELPMNFDPVQLGMFIGELRQVMFDILDAYTRGVPYTPVPAS